MVRSALTDSVLPGALVSVEGGGVNLQADPEGRFRIRHVSLWAGAAHGAAPGSTVPAASPVSVAAGDTTYVEVRLRPAAIELAELTVIGTRADLEERRARLAQVPGSVALVEAEEIRSTRQANLKDVLGFTPGVYVQPRFGAADESQISIRGSGLRNNFHARGVNLLVNGMPYRNADGFTDFESLELLNTESIEVYKGGNAPGMAANPRWSHQFGNQDGLHRIEGRGWWPRGGVTDSSRPRCPPAATLGKLRLLRELHPHQPSMGTGTTRCRDAIG